MKEEAIKANKSFLFILHEEKLETHSIHLLCDLFFGSFGPFFRKLTFLGDLKLKTLTDYLEKQYGDRFIMGRAGSPTWGKIKTIK